MGVTEGVSSVGCSVPMVYTPAHIGSEIFERLRSSKYTPSVSHSLDSSLREGAGNGLCHSSGYSLKSGVTGDFHRPYETQNVLHSTTQRAAGKPWGYGRFSSPLRRAGAIHPTARIIRGYGRFSSPLRKGAFHWGKNSVGDGKRMVFDTIRCFFTCLHVFSPIGFMHNA